MSLKINSLVDVDSATPITVALEHADQNLGQLKYL